MAKSSSIFVCQNCSASYPKWQGQCDSCGEWGTVVEELARKGKAVGKSLSGSGKRGATLQSQLDPELLAQSVVSLGDVGFAAQQTLRETTGLFEFDRVLGGGMVAGAVMLIGGQPGIGKSTLLTQALMKIVLGKPTSKPILYICGEESPSQISLRIKRIVDNEYKTKSTASGTKLTNKLGEHILFITSTDADEACVLINKHQPRLVVVDSIQTMTTEDLSGAAGSVGQVRETTDRITTVVKQLGIPTFLVGHVTKDGAIAGPKVLEHIVDAVLELSGERTGQLRILRAIKNRFGATDEVGVFRMNEYGLEEVSNPSDLFLEHADVAVPGSVTACVMEGTRPLLIELQALVVSSQLAMPRRVGRGLELSRIQVLAAVLQKHCGLPLGSTDIFVNAAGGLKVKEPAADLGLAIAMASSLKNKPLSGRIAFIGEVGLLGEIRSVGYLDKRIKEAKRLGFKKVISRKTHQQVKQVLREVGL
jgi:DNA repair protein RadA/Sms